MWVASYSDGTELAQFDAEGNERLFKEIDLDRLAIFEVALPNDQGETDWYGVGLTEAVFRIRDSFFRFEGFEKAKLKFIYFRRVKQSLGTGGDSGTETLECLGFEANGKKRIMKVSEETHAVSFEVK